MCTEDAVKEMGFVICTVYQLSLGDKIKDDIMGGACRGDMLTVFYSEF